MQNKNDIFKNRFFSAFQINEWVQTSAKQSRAKQNYFHFNYSHLNYQSFFHKIYEDTKLQQNFFENLYQAKLPFLQNFQIQKNEYFKQYDSFNIWEMLNNTAFVSKNSSFRKNVFLTKNGWFKNLRQLDKLDFQFNQYRVDETKQKLYQTIVQTKNSLFHYFYEREDIKTIFSINDSWLKNTSLFYESILWAKKIQYKNKNRYFYNRKNHHFLQNDEKRNLFYLENDFYEFENKKFDGNRNTDINFNSYFFSKQFFRQYQHWINAFFSKAYVLKNSNNQYQHKRKYLDNYNSNNFFNWHKNYTETTVYWKDNFYNINNKKNYNSYKSLSSFNKIFFFFDEALKNNFFFQNNPLFLHKKNSDKNLYLLEKSNFYIQQNQRKLLDLQNTVFLKKQSQFFNEKMKLQFLKNDNFKYHKKFSKFSYFAQPLYQLKHNIDWKKNNYIKFFNDNKIFSKNKLVFSNDKKLLFKTNFYFDRDNLLFFKKYNNFSKNKFYFQSYSLEQIDKFSHLIKKNNLSARYHFMQRENAFFFYLLKSKQENFSFYSDWLIQKKQKLKQIYEVENKKYFNYEKEIDSFFINQKFVFQNFQNKFYLFKNKKSNILKTFYNREEKLENETDILQFNPFIKNQSFSIKKSNYHLNYRNDEVFQNFLPFWKFAVYKSKNFLLKNKFLKKELDFFEQQQKAFFDENFLYSFLEYPFENKVFFEENKNQSMNLFFTKEDKKIDEQTYLQKNVIFDIAEKSILYSYFHPFFHESEMNFKNKQNFYQTNLIQKTKNFSFLLSRKKQQYFDKTIQKKLFFIQNKSFKKDIFKKKNIYHTVKNKNFYDFKKDTDKNFYDFKIYENAEGESFNFYEPKMYDSFISSEMTNSINRNSSIYKKMRTVFLQTAKKNANSLFLQEFDSKLNLIQKQYFLQTVFEKEKSILNLQQKNIVYQQQKEEVQTSRKQFDSIQNKVFVNQLSEKEKVAKKMEKQIDFEQSYIYKKEKSVAVDVVELENKIVKSVFETLEKQFFENENRRKKESISKKETFEQSNPIKQKENSFSDTALSQIDTEKLYEKIYEKIERAIRIERRKIGR